MIQINTALHLAEILGILGAAWTINRKFTRLLDLFEEYPLHRHINGKIIYPKGFEPGAVEKQAL